MDLGPLVLSIQIAAAATVVAGVVGMSVAALVALKKFVGRDLLAAVAATPIVLPPTVLGYYLLTAFGRSSVIGRAFHAATGSTIVFTKTGAVIAAAVGALPLVIWVGRAALEAVDARLVLAARTLGAGPVRAFFTVQLPLAARGVIAAVMLAFARSLGDFGATLMVAGDIPGETQTAALKVYDDVQALRDAEATGLVMVLSAVAIAVLYAVAKLTRARGGDARA